MTGCRIGRVKMKGGADVRVLHHAPLDSSRQEMLRHARVLTTAYGRDPLNFVFLVWNDSGAYHMGAKVRKESAITLTLLPHWVEEAVRRELVTSSQIREVVDNEYVTPRGPAA